MINFNIRELSYEDKDNFIAMMKSSVSLHHPWVNAPITDDEFDVFYQKYQHDNQKCLLVVAEDGSIAGVFNINEIVRGSFQSGYLGFYATLAYSGEGYMSSGLKWVLNYIFNELGLHRIEANIQPENIKSINLVKRNGFIKVGLSPYYLKINDKWCDHQHWALTIEDYEKNKLLCSKL